MDPDEAEVLEGQVYSFKELDHVHKSIAPHAFEDDVLTLWGPNSGGGWDVGSLLLGVPSL